MKTIIAVCLMLVMGNACAFDEWTPDDTKWQAGFTAVTALDWMQTLHMKQHMHTDCINTVCTTYQNTEANPILGPNPSNAKVNAYFAGVLIGHYLVAKALPLEWRRKWQQAGIAIEIYTDIRNYRFGLTAGF